MINRPCCAFAEELLRLSTTGTSSFSSSLTSPLWPIAENE
jgi:hypothetical protein